MVWSHKIKGLFFLIVSFIVIFISCTPALKSTQDPRQNEVENAYTLILDVYKPEFTFNGTTVLVNSTNPKEPYIVEIDMKGQVRWYYEIPKSILKGCDISRGADIEWLPLDDHFLFVLPYKGVYEINREGRIVWSYETNKISHDADRLPNGNTLIVWGWDTEGQAQVTEVSKGGEIVWRWFAEEHLKDIYRPTSYSAGKGGYFHANSASRLNNGNTLISLKDFNMVVEVNSAGEVVWSIDNLTMVHDPEVLSNGNLLLSVRLPDRTIEITRDGNVVWDFQRNDVRKICYNHRLPNGNTLIVERTKIIEVSANREVVWQVSNKKVDWGIDPKLNANEKQKKFARLIHQWFYKAERLPEKE